jgi:Protease inhibitor Inh
MKHLIAIAVAGFLVGSFARAQPQPLNDSAKGMIGAWEFSNAARDKVCTVTFNGAAAKVGYKLKFDPACAALFPLVVNVVGWRYPEDDLLYLLDSKGNALVEFSEVEDGQFEAPTPGVGVLFLHNPALEEQDDKEQPGGIESPSPDEAVPQVAPPPPETIAPKNDGG